MLIDNVKLLIKTSGLKQKVVAEKAGMTEQQLCDLLNGRKTFTSDYVCPLANALNVTPNVLFGIE